MVSMIETRAATSVDIPILAELWYERALIQQIRLAPDARERWSAAALLWLDDTNAQMFAAMDDHHPVGYIVGRIQPTPPGFTPEWEGVIAEIAIDSHQYHSGIGRQLVDAMRTWFHSRQIEQIIVFVPQRSAVEQAFWRGLGAAKWMEVLWLK
jgi:ribosomal protein S18 acetylase RimI-like enzyme